MIDMYGSRPTEAAQQISGRAMEAGAQATAGLRTRSSSRAAFTKALSRQRGNIFDAIEAWGIKNVLNWKENSAQIMQSLQQDLSQMRQKAQQARAQGDMEMYKLAMQRVLFDKQMEAHAQMLNSEQMGSIISGIVAGLGQIAAGYFSREVPQMESVNWRDYLYQSPPHGGGYLR